MHIRKKKAKKLVYTFANLPFWQMTCDSICIWYIFCSYLVKDLKVLKDLNVLNFQKKQYNYEYNEQQNRKPTEVRY